jgi:hypothetical protein
MPRVVALDGRFGIDPHALGEERFERLWANAIQQHDQPHGPATA